MATIRFGKQTYQIPGPRPLRIGVGIALIIGGIFGFLPVLGFWMIPLGILVLSVDIHPVRRARRRFDVWFGRRQTNNRLNEAPQDASSGGDRSGDNS